MMPGLSQAKYNPRVFTVDDFRSISNGPLSTIRKMVHDSEQQNIHIAFDVGFLMLWAQLHPCTAAFRRLAPYCRNGESVLTLFLRDPTPEDANSVVPCWPDIIDDCFVINKSARLRKITVL
ncbi:hypothetical protein K456DRAFT_348185 [Colletotrichum gloeosporioides 23]|nr:hypothetical protein K456DRAFT_348185 [Colletotrichum gloeosporioides 23]